MSVKVLIKNIFSVGLIQIANYLFPLFSLPIISRIIGPEKFGVINFSAAFIAYFTLLIGYGFDATAVRRIVENPNDEDKRNSIFNEVFQTQVLLLLLSAAVFSICLYLVPDLRNEKEVAIFTFLTCLATVLTQNWLFQAMHDLSKIAILSLVSKVLFTVVVLLVVRHREDYVWHPLVSSIAALTAGVISFVWSISRYKIKFKLVPIKQCINLLKNEHVFFISIVIINLYTTTNTVLLGFFHDAKQVAYYSSGIRLIAIFQSLTSSILSQAFYPFVGRAFAESFDKGVSTAQKILPLALLFTFAAALSFFIVGPFVLSFLYGPQFAPSVNVFRILIFTPVMITFSTVMGIHVMLNLKMDKKFFRISLWGAVFSIALNLAIVIPFGYVASAIALFLTELLISILFYIQLRKQGIDIINKEYFTVKSVKHYLTAILKKRLD